MTNICRGCGIILILDDNSKFTKVMTTKQINANKNNSAVLIIRNTTVTLVTQKEIISRND